MIANLKVTMDCNANCDFCYEEKSKEILDVPSACIIIDKLFRQECGWLYLSGGEPLTHAGITEIIRYAAGKGIKTKLSTNGILLTGKIIKELELAGLTELYVSLGDLTDEILSARINQYKELCEMEKSLKLVFSILVTNRSVGSLKKHLDILAINGFSCVHLIPAKSGRSRDWNRENLLHTNNFIKLASNALVFMDKLCVEMDCSIIRFLTALHRVKNALPGQQYCGAGCDIISIQPDGVAKPCTFSKEDLYYGGNILTDDFTDIFNGNAFQNFVKENNCGQMICPYVSGLAEKLEIGEKLYGQLNG